MSEQSQIREWLSEMGRNNALSNSQVVAKINVAISFQELNQLYLSWEPQSLSNYQSFFLIPSYGVRSDVSWTDSEFHIPFTEPGLAAIHAFLADNIQDEWGTGVWKLILDFMPSARAHVQFQAGALPHVNQIGGDIITMDANAPLTEYDVQWTIRHEFGHVLGFPDCYLEFYDADQAVIINYQLDTTNLMCSRKGHLQAKHVDELKRAYSARH